MGGEGLKVAGSMENSPTAMNRVSGMSLATVKNFTTAAPQWAPMVFTSVRPVMTERATRF